MTEKQKEIEEKLLLKGWKEKTGEVDKNKGKKRFSKKGYTVIFDYINIGLIDKKGGYLFRCTRPDTEQVLMIFNI